jgi:hypothetical protein
MARDHVVSLDLCIDEGREKLFQLGDRLERRAIGSKAAGEIDRVARPVRHRVEESVVDVVIASRAVNAH